MDKKIDYKRGLQKNRDRFVNGLGNANAVADSLYALQIFTEEMRDEVYQEEEKENKNRKILDILNYREKLAVPCLHDALLETDNNELAELFAPYVMEIKEEDNFNSPTKWPSDMEEQIKMAKDPVIKIKDLKHPSFIHEYTSKEVYQMKNWVRGKAYIINDVDFITKAKLRKRRGSDIDAGNLHNVFTQLQFDVITSKNLTAREMIEFLKQERDKVNWDDMECVILVIMSHGETTGVYGQDGNITPLQKLTEVFDSSNCPGLNKKPRLVFVQACRAGQIIITDTSEKKEGLESLYDGVQKLNLQDSPDVLDAAPSEDIQSLPKTVHSAADYFIAYATPEGTKVFTPVEVCSWFLNAVMWTFKYHAYQTDIHYLMLKVNALVANAISESGELTVCEWNSRLRKKLFFFPGVYDYPPKTIDS